MQLFVLQNTDDHSGTNLIVTLAENVEQAHLNATKKLPRKSGAPAQAVIVYQGFEVKLNTTIVINFQAVLRNLTS